MLSWARCLAASVAGQCMSIWEMVSSSPWHSGHVEDTLPCLLRLTVVEVGYELPRLVLRGSGACDPECTRPCFQLWSAGVSVQYRFL
eukprot:2580561-Rhodomonas_salina.1